MKVLLQKVQKAWVDVEGETVGEIAGGFLLFVGITHEDTTADADKLAEKILKLRLFAQPGSKTFMEHDIVEEGGGLLVVSQFTLYGETKKGRRPDFGQAAKPEQAKELYQYFFEKLQQSGLHVETGEFGAHMEVHLVNDGPITLMLES